jgi:hypothetical protein
MPEQFGDGGSVFGFVGLSRPPDEIERVDSGAGQLSTSTDGLVSRDATIRWLVHSIKNYAAAEKKAATLAPLEYDGHKRTSLVTRPVGNGWYEIEATYGNAGVDVYPSGYGIKNSDDVTMIPAGLSVDTTGGTEHITTAWSNSGTDEIESPGPIVTGYAAEGETAPDSEGAINVSGGRVGGVDVTVPSFQWTETWLVPSWYLVNGNKPQQSKVITSGDPAPKSPYGITLHDMTGAVNTKDFRSFKPGEVLFLGAKFDTNRTSTLTPVSYSFSAKANRTNFKIGNVTVAEKAGQDFMWIQYADASAGGSPVKRAKYVYVDQVYRRKDFADLEIGVFWPRFYLVGGETFTQPFDEEKKGLA